MSEKEVQEVQEMREVQGGCKEGRETGPKKIREQKKPNKQITVDEGRNTCLHAREKQVIGVKVLMGMTLTLTIVGCTIQWMRTCLCLQLCFRLCCLLSVVYGDVHCITMSNHKFPDPTNASYSNNSPYSHST